MLRIENLSLKRPGWERRYPDFVLDKGDLLVVTGSSGCGKSSLLDCIAGYETPTSGLIEWKASSLADLSAEQRPFSRLFQEENLFEHISLEENFRLCLGAGKRQDWKSASRRLNLESELHKQPGECSGGQRQRAGLIAATLRPEPVLLLDEPFSNLDAQTTELCLSWLLEQATDHQRTIILVSHTPISQELPKRLGIPLKLLDLNFSQSPEHHAHDG